MKEKDKEAAVETLKFLKDIQDKGKKQVLDKLEKWSVEEKKEILDHIDKMKYNNVVVISPDRAPAYFLGLVHAYKSCLREIERLRSSYSKAKEVKE